MVVLALLGFGCENSGVPRDCCTNLRLGTTLDPCPNPSTVLGILAYFLPALLPGPSLLRSIRLHRFPAVVALGLISLAGDFPVPFAVSLRETLGVPLLTLATEV